MSRKVDQDQNEDTTDRTVDGDTATTAAEREPDAEDLALQAARREVEAEEAGEDGAGGDDADEPAETDPSADETEQQPEGREEAPAGGDQPSQPESVPYARFAEQNAQLNQLRERAAYQDGVIEALRSGAVAPPAQPQQPAPSRQDLAQARIEAAQQEVEAAADKMDKGEITAKQFSAIQNKANQDIAAVQNALVLGAARDLFAQQQPPQPQPAPEQHVSLSDQDYVNRHLEGLVAKYPTVGPDSPLTEHDAVILANMVFTGLRDRGQLDPNPVVRTMQIREGAAQLAEILVPQWYPNYRPPDQPAAAQQQQPPGNATGQPQLSPQAQARANKLALADNHPPDVRGVGSAGESEGLSDTRVIAMTEQELEALPRGALKHLLE